MRGLENITAKIVSDAENDARVKLSAASAECEKLRADYEKRADELRERMLSEAEAEAELRVQRAKAACAVSKRNAILSAKSESVDAAFSAAAAEVFAMDAEKYRALLVGLVCSALTNQVNAEKNELENYGDAELCTYDSFEIAMNKSDLAAHGEAVIEGVRRASIGRLDPSVTEKLSLSKKAANIDGGVIIKYGEMEINCSLSMIFSGLRASLESEIYNILFTQN